MTIIAFEKQNYMRQRWKISDKEMTMGLVHEQGSSCHAEAMPTGKLKVD